MKKTILVVGFGPGISAAVAEKFGTAGLSVALVARSEGRLAEGIATLKSKGIDARSFVADAGDPAALRAAIARARAELGPIHVVLWNAYGAGETGDLLAADDAAVANVFDVAIGGLVAAVQETLPDLEASKGAVLITNGAFGDLDPQIDGFAVSTKAMGLALGNAAKHKLAGLLAARLKPAGVYVGEVTVAASVIGTAWDSGSATLEPSRVADLFWTLFEGKSETYARIS